MRRAPVILFLLIGACAAGDDSVCRVGADCASGVCLADGTCAPIGADGGADTDADLTPRPDASPDMCQANHDGVIARAEVTTRAGLTATFRVALDTPVDTAGELQGDGSRHWNLAGELTGDADIDVELLPVAGAWFEDVFEDADYAGRLSQREELLGVFRNTPTELQLLGVVSPEAGLTRTELVYDPPITVLEFPITTSSEWATTSTVSGLAQGVAAFYSEEYDQRVDALGQLDTPFGPFPVMRVRVELRRVVGAVPVTSRSFLFVSECFGTVATVSSEDYESEIEFTQAAEVRRISQ